MILSRERWSIQWVALQTIFINQLSSIFRIWTQTLLPPAITMTLYFLIFGSLIGSQLREIDGFSYIQYITPGLILMTAITTSYTQVVFAVFTGKTFHSLEELLISPAWNITILLGFISGGVLRGTLSAFIVLMVSLFFTGLHVESILFSLFLVLLATTFMSIIAFLNGILANTFDDISIVPTFVLTPLTYLGGVFFSVSMLPGFWHHLALFNPFLYMINAFRYGFLGISDVPITLALIIVLACLGVLFTVCLYILHTGWRLRA